MGVKRYKAWTHETGVRVRLGKLCKRGHDFLNSGMSLKRDDNGDCLECSSLRSKNRVLTPEQYERKKSQSNRRYHENKEEINAKRAIQYRENEKLRIDQKRRSKKHYEANRTHFIVKAILQDQKAPSAHQFRRARAWKNQRNHVCGDYGFYDVLDKLAQFNNCCAYCQKHLDIKQKERDGNYLTLDHIVPLSKDGQDILSNVLAICWSCNRDKSNHDFQEWYRSKEFYSQRLERKIIQSMRL